MVGFITGIPVHVLSNGNKIKMAEINFLCVHKKLRSNRLAPVLIKEVTRRVHLRKIWQAVNKTILLALFIIIFRFILLVLESLLPLLKEDIITEVLTPRSLLMYSFLHLFPLSLFRLNFQVFLLTKLFQEWLSFSELMKNPKLKALENSRLRILLKSLSSFRITCLNLRFI